MAPIYYNYYSFRWITGSPGFIYIWALLVNEIRRKSELQKRLHVMLVKENICVSPKLESVIIRSDDVSSSKTVLMKVIKTDVKFVNVRKKKSYTCQRIPATAGFYHGYILNITEEST
jgi:hypothetical protein